MRVLVTGIGGPAGKSTVRFFLEKGEYVIGTDIREIEADTHDFSLVPPGNSEDFIPTILKILKEKKVNVFIPTVTEELPSVSRNRWKIRSLGISLYIPSYSVVKIVNNKYLTSKKLEELGLPAPRTVRSGNGITPEVAGKILGYPFVAKPIFGRGGRGLSVYYTPEQASKENREDIVFQEFIPGEEYDANLFVYPEGRVKKAVVLRKTKLKNGIVGNALEVERAMDAEDVLNLAILASKKLLLEGPIDMDIRRNKKNQPVVLEINARVGANILKAKEVLEEFYKILKKGEKT